jgi:formylglycine-generating enzyme
VGEAEGTEYRLPSEAEWEYACRAGTTTAFNWGDAPASAGGAADGAPVVAAKCNGPDKTVREAVEFQGAEWPEPFPWYDRYVYTASVGSFSPNAFGLYDMHGNVWEWCGDWYAQYPSGPEPARDPKGPEQRRPAAPGAKSGRVQRGGGWAYDAARCRSAARSAIEPTYQVYDVGFRVVCVDRPMSPPNQPATRSDSSP